MTKPIKVYAGYSKNKDIRLKSSSGAIFTSLAEYVLNRCGIVYGVAMADDCYSAQFIAVTVLSDLSKLRGSKYLQAKVGNTFRKVRENLNSGKMVLFSGTACQVNGLKKFLGKDYDNLICVDVICHGTPSPALWKKYAQFQEKKMGGKLKKINFRCKDKSWIDFGGKEVLKNISKNHDMELFISKDDDPYMQMFLRDYCLRPSCYECIAKNVKLSDLTIADFWGIENVAPNMNDGFGISLVILRTKNGYKMFNYISKEMNLEEVSYESGVKGNPSEYKSCIRPAQRDTFFRDMHQMNFMELKNKYISSIKYSFIKRTERRMKSIVKKFFLKNRMQSFKDNISNSYYCLHFVFENKEEQS